MREQSISIKTLYEAYGPVLTYTKITAENGYYDLNDNLHTVCLDGEVCMVLEETDTYYLLQNGDGEIPTTFKLSREEYECATYKERKIDEDC